MHASLRIYFNHFESYIESLGHSLLYHLASMTNIFTAYDNLLLLKLAKIQFNASLWARHPGMWSQVGLKKHHYEQSYWRWWIPVELFQILKDDAMKVLHSICQQIWKTQQWPQDWKMWVFIPIPKKGNVKECSNYHTIALISHASNVMLKILQARLQEYVNHELPDVQAGFRKGRGIRDQIAKIHWIIEKAREFQKNIYFCFIDYSKAFVCVDHNKLENSSRDGNTRPPDLPLSLPPLTSISLLLLVIPRSVTWKRAR